MTASDTTPARVNSLVFMDFESTGIPAFEFQPRATEVCLIAVERRHFESLEEEEKELRVQNKLQLCCYPQRRISPNSTYLTGLSNENLQNQKPVDDDFVTAILAFLRHLPAPVCLIAHNGNNFDFPLLQAEVRRLGCMLPKDLLCADSYCAFRALLEDLPTQTNFLSVPLESPFGNETQTADNLSLQVVEEPITSLDEDKESEWLEEKCLVESLGFATEYNDSLSEEETGNSDNPDNYSVPNGDKVNASSGQSNTADSKVVFLDCDHPRCECSDCKPKRLLCVVKQKQICDEDDVKSNLSVCEENSSKQLPGVEKININGNHQKRKSVIVSPESNKPVFPVCNGQKLAELPTTDDASYDNVLKTCNSDVDAQLDMDMDFVVAYVSSPEFIDLDSNIEIELSKRQADITPLKADEVPCAPRLHTHKNTLQNGGLSDNDNERQREVSGDGGKHDKVRKRLFAGSPIASTDFNCDKFATSILSANNGTFKRDGCVSNAYSDDIRETSADVNVSTSSFTKSRNVNTSKNREAVRRSPPKRICNGVTTTNNGPALVGVGEAGSRCEEKINLGNKHSTEEASPSKQTSAAEPTTKTSAEGVKNSVCFTTPAQTQQYTQQRAKHRYGLEALHELLVGTKPPVSHTAEDDTKSLMRLCRTKRKEFCEWVDNHAVLVNVIRPMW